MRSLTIRLLFALAALAVPVVATGCGSDDVDFRAAVAQAADNTVAVDGMRVATTTRIGDQELHGTGFQDLKGGRASMHMDVPDLGRMDFVIDDFVMYLRLPDDAGADLPHGKDWIRVDLRKALSASGIDLDSIATASGTDAGAQLQQLKATGDIEKVGTEEVRNVPTTHYRGTIDLRKVPASVPADQRAAAKRSIDKLIEQSGGEAEIPVELWIGMKDNRVHRLHETVPNPDGDVDTTIEFYDFGARDRVEVPDKADTVDFTDETAKALP
jgi:hypothetical protein